MINQNFILTTVISLVRAVWTIRTDITNMMMGYACHVIRTQKMRICWTAILGYAREIF